MLKLRNAKVIISLVLTFGFLKATEWWDETIAYYLMFIERKTYSKKLKNYYTKN